MKSAQSQILKKYMDLNGQPTLREICEDTGIQLTRIFRLLNGSEMKIGEYMTFKNRINKNFSGNSLQELGAQCDRLLSEEIKSELVYLLKNKIKMQNYKSEARSYIKAA